MAQRSFWKAGLVGFLASTILFMTLPLPETLSIRAQVAVLTILQLVGILSFCLAWLLLKGSVLPSGRSVRTGPEGVSELFARLGPKRPYLRLVHSQSATNRKKESDNPSPR